MDFSWTAEQQELLEGAKKFAAERLVTGTAERDRIEQEDHGTTESLQLQQATEGNPPKRETAEEDGSPSRETGPSSP